MKTLTFYRPNFWENALNDFDRYMESFTGNSLLPVTERLFNTPPRIDIRDSEKAYFYEAELPGFEEKEIAIEVDNNILTISGSKEEIKEEDRKEKYLLKERNVKSINRSFSLPDNADADDVKASFKNGVLTLEIGKKTSTVKKQIPIS